MATLDRLIGTELGQYKIIEKLGQGGMATVFKAHEQSLNRIVALKVLHPSLAENEEYIKRFKREAQSAAKLNHPNIVHIYAIGEDLGHHFFAMELIKGESLADFKRSGQKMGTQRILAITRQIASGLAAAHEAGLVHRDIKPSNIMLLGNGTVKIADFGIAQITGGETKLTLDGAVIGTPEYLSPEQCEGKAIDGRSDIYSLGVTLYELLSGKTPYEADTPVGMLMKIVKGEHPPLGSIAPDIPDDIESLVKRMMAHRIEDRFSSAQALIQAIDSLAPSPVTQPSAEALLTTLTPETQIRQKPSRPPWALAALLLLALGLAGAMYLQWIPNPWSSGKHPISVQSEPSPGEDPLPSRLSSAEESPQTQAENPTLAAQADANKTDSPIRDEQGIGTNQSDPPTTTPEQTNKPTSPKQEAPSQSKNQSLDPSQAETFPGGQPSDNPKTEAESQALYLYLREESEYEELILTHIEQHLFGQDLTVIRGGPESPAPHTLLAVSFRITGSTPLQYYKRSSEQYHAFLTLSLLEMPARTPLLPPQRQELSFTSLNAKENIESAIDMALAGFNWQSLKERRRKRVAQFIDRVKERRKGGLRLP